VLHFFEHFPHARQPDILQFVGQFRRLQILVVESLGHFLPPYLGLTRTLRRRVCLPPPHFLVHFDQALQPVTAQWIGHLRTLHLAVCLRVGHFLPPFLGVTLIPR